MSDRAVTSSEQPVPRTITRATGLIAMVLSLPWLFILGYFGELERGFLAFGSSVVMLTLGVSYWRFRGRAWFWGAMVMFSGAHIGLVALIPEPRFQYAAFMIPVFLLDFIALSFAMGAMGDRAR